MFCVSKRNLSFMHTKHLGLIGGKLIIIFFFGGGGGKGGEGIIFLCLPPYNLNFRYFELKSQFLGLLSNKIQLHQIFSKHSERLF